MKELNAILYLAALGVASHFIGNILPRKWFCSDRFPYKCYAWEKGGRIYQKIGVQKWKDKVPDMSRICGDMRPKTMKLGMGEADISALIAETSVAECVHWFLILLSPVILFMCPNAFGYILCLIDIVLFNLPFIIIQRYNRPKMLKIKAAIQRKQGGTASENETSDTLR